MITYDQFKEVELRVARVLAAERVEGSEKLIRLEVVAGDENPRQLVAGIGKQYTPGELIQKNIIIVANLEPRKLMGLESNGMLLAASTDTEGPVLLTVMEHIDPGASIK